MSLYLVSIRNTMQFCMAVENIWYDKHTEETNEQIHF